MIVGSLLQDIVFLGDKLRLEQHVCVHVAKRRAYVHACVYVCPWLYEWMWVHMCAGVFVLDAAFVSSWARACKHTPIHTSVYESKWKYVNTRGCVHVWPRRCDGQSHPRPLSRQGRHSMIYTSAEFLSLVSHHALVTWTATRRPWWLCDRAEATLLLPGCHADTALSNVRFAWTHGSICANVRNERPREGQRRANWQMGRQTDRETDILINLVDQFMYEYVARQTVRQIDRYTIKTLYISLFIHMQWDTNH